MINLYMPATAAIISAILLLVYCSKERVKVKENNIYLVMLICIMIDSLCVSGIYINSGEGESITLIKILNRCDYMALVSWSSCLWRYAHAVIHKKDNANYRRHRISRRVITGMAMVECVLIWILGLDAVIENGIAAAIMGPAVIFTFSCCAIHLLMCLFVILFNYNNITKRIVPVFICLGIAALCAVIYYINPTISGVSMGLTIVNLTMYFTIENPDYKMLETVNQAKDRAIKASQAKTDFLSGMSHEIRTPINAIVGLAECIQNDDSLELAKRDARDILSASQNLLEIVNGILDISKIEAGKMEVVNKEYDLVDISENLSKIIKVRIGDKPIDLRPHFSKEIPGVIFGDETKIREIMTNLLTNAVKYTEKGYINFIIDCENVDNMANLVIAVSDTGHGIKEEAIDGLFEKFTRFEEGRNSNIEGTGLGLSLTKQFVEMLGGTIEVNSVYGEGTTFTVKLAQEIRSIERRAENKETEIQSEYPGHKVLVVDDTEMNRVVAERLLEFYKVDADIVSSGEECLEMCKTKKYELILLDDMMPNMTGKDTLLKLRELPSFDTPVVVFTANAIDGMREAYLKDGYSDYLSKPIIKDELNRVLEQYLK